MRKFIKEKLKENINNLDIWYHGTPDVKDLERDGGFTEKFNQEEYIENIEHYNELQSKLKITREKGDEDMYFKLLDEVPKLKKQFKYRKPIFLTNKYNVAKTYADPQRAFDYLNAVEKVLTVKVNCNNLVKINTTGERFRFISVNYVKRGFLNAGIDENLFNQTLEKFIFWQKDKTRMRTDLIAVLGYYFNFDCIDVIGVLDSYHGGSTKSTVKMVLNPNIIKIIKDDSMSENINE